MRGRGLVRRRMATSWRSTRSSMSFAENVRPISRTNSSTCPKIKYSNVRHEALLWRMEVRDLRCSAVVAVG
jgi:hypothetical protein